jgi:hypothetical protein
VNFSLALRVIQNSKPVALAPRIVDSTWPSGNRRNSCRGQGETDSIVSLSGTGGVAHNWKPPETLDSAVDRARSLAPIHQRDAWRSGRRRRPSVATSLARGTSAIVFATWSALPGGGGRIGSHYRRTRALPRVSSDRRCSRIAPRFVSQRPYHDLGQCVRYVSSGNPMAVSGLGGHPARSFIASPGTERPVKHS